MSRSNNRQNWALREGEIVWFKGWQAELAFLDCLGNVIDSGTVCCAAGPETMRTTPSVPIPPANQHKTATERSKPTDQAEQRKRTARQKKIDGMEFYEWAELIRSSSL